MKNPTDIIDYFGSDAPLWHQHMDAFDRADFTSRISELIVNRDDPHSIVVGVCGELEKQRS